MSRSSLSKACLLATLTFAPACLNAQTWQLKTHGVGLFDNSRPDYDAVLRPVQAGSSWNLQDLTPQNAFGSNAPQTFGAWIQGPDPKTYLNANGVPVFLYKVRVTNAKGQVQTFGPHGFYAGGHATLGLGVQGGPFGTWKVEWFTVHRDTKAETLIASDTFEILEKAVSAPGQPQTQNVHVGLYDGSRPDYDQKLVVVKSGARWSLAQLSQMNAFNVSGANVFGAWYQGPHTRTFTNSNGVIEYLYKVKVTNPRGQSSSYGPYGFYVPGFAAYFLGDVQNGLTGTWTVEWFTVHRDTKQEKSVQTDAFEMMP